MTQPSNISADYTLRPSELAEVLALAALQHSECVVSPLFVYGEKTTTKSREPKPLKLQTFSAP